MTYSLPTNNLTMFLSELNKIRRGIHSNFRGDGIYNSDALLLGLCSDSPVKALEIAEKLEGDVESDFHPSRVKSFAKAIRRNLFILNS